MHDFSKISWILFNAQYILENLKFRWKTLQLNKLQKLHATFLEWLGILQLTWDKNRFAALGTLASGVARIFFEEGGTVRPFKGYHAPPAGGLGAKVPRTVAKFHILKRFKVFDNQSIFSKKKFENLNTFYKNFWVYFEKLF